MTYNNRLRQLLDSEIVRLTLVFSALVLILSFVYLPNQKVPSLDDPFYHIRFAQDFQERGLDAFRDFKWIYFSKAAMEPQGYFPYYSFLFYFALIPFSWFEPQVLGIKLFGSLSVAFSLTVLYYFLRKQKIKYPEFYLLFALATFPNLVDRFLSARPFALSPALLIILLYFLYRRNYLGAALLSIIYFFWHPASFFFPVVISVIYIVFEKFWHKKADWKKIMSVAGGTVAAYLASLSFAPGLLSHFKETVLGPILYLSLRKKTPILEGLELYKQDILNYLQSNLLIFIVLLTIIFLETYFYWRQRKNSEFDYSSVRESTVLRYVLLFLTIGFLMAISRSFRFQDYFVFFALAYIPLAIHALWSNIDIKINPEAVKKVMGISLVIVVVAVSANNLLFFSLRLSDKPNYETVMPAAFWLKENAKPQTVIFNTRWSDFPLLVYFNPKNYYVIGMEPHFLFKYDPEIYWLWHHLTLDGSVCNKEICNEESPVVIETKDGIKLSKAGEIIRHIFQAEYVITGINYQSTRKINVLLKNSSEFQLAYEDPWYKIYKVSLP